MAPRGTAVPAFLQACSLPKVSPFIGNRNARTKTILCKQPFEEDMLCIGSRIIAYADGIILGIETLLDQVHRLLAIGSESNARAVAVRGQILTDAEILSLTLQPNTVLPLHTV
jgi:hypothetical protein